MTDGGKERKKCDDEGKREQDGDGVHYFQQDMEKDV